MCRESLVLVSPLESRKEVWLHELIESELGFSMDVTSPLFL